MGHNTGGGSANDSGHGIDDQKKELLKLTFGVFFDGTLNSIANIDERKKFSDFKESHTGSSKGVKKRGKIIDNNGSYNNEYTNVARFFKCFEKKNHEIIPIYVEGIGTKPRNLDVEIDFDSVPDKEKKKSYDEYGTYDKNGNPNVSLEQFINDNNGFISCSDDQLGSAFGIGLFGVKKKVESACEKILLKVKEVLKEEANSKVKKVEMTFFVFGFSRGSAAARCFSSCLFNKKGKTVEKASANTRLIGVKNVFTLKFDEVRLKSKLKKENDYKTSLFENWLDSYFKEKSIQCEKNKNVEFLGVYDTVSSYGSDFTDDVDELSLKIDESIVKNVFQVCAGDEYRRNFALTDISSLSNNENSYIIIPGAHSDVGGGYAHGTTQKREGFLGKNAGNLTLKLLESEGWFEPEENERVVSNLYSIIPFNIMHDQLAHDELFDHWFLKKYNVLDSGIIDIDGIEHEHNKLLYEFYKKLKSKSIYKYVINTGSSGNTIDFLEIPQPEECDELRGLKKEEDMLMDDICRLRNEINSLYLSLDPEVLDFDTLDKINELIESKKDVCKKLYDVKKEKCQYDDAQLLKIIRHEYLHLSVKADDFTDTLVNKSNNKRNKRLVIAG